MIYNLNRLSETSKLLSIVELSGCIHMCVKFLEPRALMHSIYILCCRWRSKPIYIYIIFFLAEGPNNLENG